jgi:hypothetical protein
MVYIGKFNWLSYADNEMVTLVLPTEMQDGSPVGLYYQWTKDANGVSNANHPVNSTFRSVTKLQNGDVRGTFDDSFYTWEVTVLRGGESATISMRNPSGSSTSFDVQHTDFRNAGTRKVSYSL